MDSEIPSDIFRDPMIISTFSTKCPSLVMEKELFSICRTQPYSSAQCWDARSFDVSIWFFYILCQRECFQFIPLEGKMNMFIRTGILHGWSSRCHDTFRKALFSILPECFISGPFQLNYFISTSDALY